MVKTLPLHDFRCVSANPSFSNLGKDKIGPSFIQLKYMQHWEENQYETQV